MTWPSTLPIILPSLILTPSKTSPFIRISFNFSLSFLSSSGCFLVGSGKIKMFLKFSEFENFWDPETTLHLKPSSNSQVDSYQCLQYPQPSFPQPTDPTHHLILLRKAKFLHNHSYFLIHILTFLDTPYDNHVLSLLYIQCLCNFLFQWYGQQLAAPSCWLFSSSSDLILVTWQLFL